MIFEIIKDEDATLVTADAYVQVNTKSDVIADEISEPVSDTAQSSITPRAPREARGSYIKRKKVCAFCAEKATEIDYKDAGKLRKFVTEHGHILPRRVTGTCAYHQRLVTTAIKRARQVALLPYKND